ncbi:MAG: hypothetical protein AW11_00188 [Candidatus Accumulibacter regalis]|uniref:Transmembrane protein n=2 Tax=Candidatus Accumulibacter TaxID=327159 RepID=A0A011RIY2_ACCRE|nr:hypothetical protein [Accumulibacter sp.]EXI91144.1 MAG: hypothetical protein AW11_00188 [Candidatus Accumulibacter regalis]MBN8514891.1 hypothetical protein [Accumulibacter sp.]
MSQVQSKKRLSGRWSRAVLVSLLAVGAHDFFAASQAYARGATRTSINHNTNVNRNTNVNVNRNVDVDVNRRGGYHPVATGVAVGAAVAVTAAVVGSMVTTLPPSCVPYVHAGITYQQCGGAYYQPQYAGSSVTYVVVDPPR